ncbi:hypothetical protein Fmac_014875 [Flemingia macrophylla]|uniref:Reverse transcriptase Ty1/copia-type domain-containing protein n=1 Tax=Flemingia macrophylla TaxID=520843 RepID=A0ABD1MDI7_9FABA
MEAIRLLIAFAIYVRMTLYQMDVKSAFLNGIINEEVYVEQPPGFENEKAATHVFKLNKALYGLKQAPRAWYDKLSSFLIENDFVRGKVDSTLFRKEFKYDFIIVQIYVDDIIFGATNEQLCKEFSSMMQDEFKMSMMGELKFFLGLEVLRDATGMYLKQSKYIGDILRKCKMENASSCPTPMVIGKQFIAEGEKLQNPAMFRQAIGALQYLTNTRPDIGFSVNKLSQFMSSPTIDHWQGIKRILRYLQGTIHYFLHIKPSTDLDLTGFSDVDWATSVNDRKSMAGQCVFLGETLVSWSSKKQKVVSRSSTESEYRALADLAAEIAWTRSLLNELKLPLLRKPTLWCDNLSAKALASNPVMHARSKHIEIDVHYIRDQVLQNKIVIAYVPSTDQVADCLTKALTHTRFNQLRDKLGVTPSPTSLKGGIRNNIP